MAESPALRQRAGKKKATITTPEPEDVTAPYTKVTSGPKYSKKAYGIAVTVLTALAFITRFYRISHPAEVVFDEVHFGKFAAYYIQRTYFFDVHPPFAKLLFGFVGWLIGFDGEFKFENIGDDYIKNNVPYVLMRALPATLGALTVPIVFGIMQEANYGLPACVLAASWVLFDNAHIAETRLILLDACLVFSMAFSIYAYVRFMRHSKTPFTRGWWMWLLLTGLGLSSVFSTKYVGLFTYFTIGVAVLFDLWRLLDVNHGLTLPQFGKHFAARAWGLIIMPFCIYLFWFWVHFTVLSKSGPGDDFMSPEFQATLSDNPLTASSVPIYYGDVITLQHKDTKAFLHSHPGRYPLRYEDGRVSSQGQQVTGYPFEDINNHWRIHPGSPVRVAGDAILNGDLFKLEHVQTNTILLTHDVASPNYPTNQEFTTVPIADANAGRFNDTVFELRMEKGKPGQPWRTKAGLARIVAKQYGVAMWTQNSKPLPDWGFKQQEINGNKAITQPSNVWYPASVVGPAEAERLATEPKKEVKTVPFLKKWWELQTAMIRHNNALTSEHPYASWPGSWPFLSRGVSFWTKDATREQIYLLGNPVGWIIASSTLAVYAGIALAQALTERRGVKVLSERDGRRIWEVTGFFVLAWAAHWIPFWGMGRQLFLHHYLPGHLCSSLVLGAVVEFIGGRIHEKAARIMGNGHDARKFKEELARGVGMEEIMVTGLLGVLVWTFWWFAPVTYGTPGLDVKGVLGRKWMSTWDLHFAK
ncbi:Dolichyl-phosphate-mannose--protein mannosyltransferase 4 [Saitoella coloradoensis]